MSVCSNLQVARRSPEAHAHCISPSRPEPTGLPSRPGSSNSWGPINWHLALCAFGGQRHLDGGFQSDTPSLGWDPRS